MANNHPRGRILMVVHPAGSRQGLEVTGESGLLQEMMKVVLEAALDEELTEHLGYEPGDPSGRGSGNSCNGTTRKTVLTESGPVELDTPRRAVGAARLTARPPT